jgi:hypothetical protein
MYHNVHQVYYYVNYDFIFWELAIIPKIHQSIELELQQTWYFDVRMNKKLIRMLDTHIVIYNFTMY